jgi:hypothetical protein
MLLVAIFVALNSFAPKPSPAISLSSLTLNLQTVVPSAALYGSQVDVKEFATSQGQPADNPMLTLSVSLGNDTIFNKSWPIDLASSTFSQDYPVTLMDPNSVIEPDVRTATIQSTLSAGNGNPALNTTSIQLWVPAATMKVDLPNSCLFGNCGPFQTPILKAGTYLFNDASVTYTGTQPGPFQVALGVVVGPQTTPYFQMNKQLAQPLTDNSGNTVWIASSNTIDSAHTLWTVPTASTEFTVKTGGITSVTISFKIVLYLVVGNGHYVLLSTTPETLQINQS